LGATEEPSQRLEPLRIQNFNFEFNQRCFERFTQAQMTLLLLSINYFRRGLEVEQRARLDTQLRRYYLLVSLLLLLFLFTNAAETHALKYLFGCSFQIVLHFLHYCLLPLIICHCFVIWWYWAIDPSLSVTLVLYKHECITFN